MIHRFLLKKESVIKGKQKKLISNSNHVLSLLFKGNCHYGHSLQSTNPINYFNIQGTRLNQSIIDLGITTQNILRSFLFLKKILKKNKFATRRGISKIVLICNSNQIKHLKIFNDCEKFGSYLHIVNSLWKSQYFSNVFNLKKKKKTKILAVVLLSTNGWGDIVKEAAKHKIPVISLIDTNQNSSIIDYPVMSNTSNLKSLYIVINLFKKLLAIKK